jgi:hypothetical protein
MDATVRPSPGPEPSDRLPPPRGIDRWAILRSLDRERLAEEAADIPAERRARIVKIRDEIRRGVYATEARLAAALAGALADLARRAPGRRPRRLGDR